MDVKKIKFRNISDERGSLVAIEQLREIPFEIKRIYYIYGVRDNCRRGFHSHKELQQILICLNGKCTLYVDNGKEKMDVVLDKPDEGLYIGPNIWREMYNFSKDSVLLVIASEYYDESDYIRDYSVFLNKIK